MIIMNDVLAQAYAMIDRPTPKIFATIYMSQICDATNSKRLFGIELY